MDGNGGGCFDLVLRKSTAIQKVGFWRGDPLSRSMMYRIKVGMVTHSFININSK